MKEQIKLNAGNPEELERLYRENRKGFADAFTEAYPEISDSPSAAFWKARLEYENRQPTARKIPVNDLLVVALVCLTAGLLIKVPDFFRVTLAGFEYEVRNAALIVTLALSAYLAWHNKLLEKKQSWISFLVFAGLALYANMLPLPGSSDTAALVYIHLPLLLWFAAGMFFVSFRYKPAEARISFIKYNGDLAVMMAIILISGGILTALTIGLFNAIGMKIDEFYANNIVKVGLVSVPVVATLLLYLFPEITGRIVPVIASIFSPLVLVTAVVFLAALAFSGQDPYNDRNFLLLFNIMLLGVMAVIVFTLTGISAPGRHRFAALILFALAIVTTLIDLVAVSAILYRLFSFGISPNRLAVAGADLLLLANLVMITSDLYRVNFRNENIYSVNLRIAGWLPVYAVWVLIVIFIFPLVFGLG